MISPNRRLRGRVAKEKAKEDDMLKMGDEIKVEGGKEYDTVPTMDKMDDDSELVPALHGIPLVPSRRNPSPGVIFVLEKASLVPAYVGRSYQILNHEVHGDFLRKKKMNPYDYRPDIVHEALLKIIGSRLCMTGGVQAIYVKTVQGVLIKVEPHTRIPKTLAPFCDMMSQLLQKFNIKARGKGQKLLQLIANPVTKHLPSNSCIIGLSFSSKKAVQLRDYISTMSNDQSLVFVVGAMAHGKIDSDYIDDFVSVSGYPLSAVTCLRRICIAMEKQRRIL